MYIYCDRPSKSAKALAKTLKIKKLRAGDVVDVPTTFINWGCTKVLIGLQQVKVINPFEAVRKAADKLLFFQAMQDTKLTPRFCTTLERAKKWILKGRTVVCRTVLNGHSGNGIVVASTPNGLVPAKLYVEYIKKETEWRVHVFQGKVIDIQRKARNKDVPDDQVNWQIRNHDNGFIYARGDVGEIARDILGDLEAAATLTVNHLKLDFGAVDIIVTKGGKVYILEVNTAPGLKGTTLENYVTAIRKLALN